MKLIEVIRIDKEISKDQNPIFPFGFFEIFFFFFLFTVKIKRDKILQSKMYFLFAYSKGI